MRERETQMMYFLNEREREREREREMLSLSLSSDLLFAAAAPNLCSIFTFLLPFLFPAATAAAAAAAVSCKLQESALSLFGLIAACRVVSRDGPGRKSCHKRA